MAYDEQLAARVRDVVFAEPGLSERRMFGGLAFLVDGRMAVATTDGGLLLRVDPAQTDTLAQRPYVRRFVMRGKELNGWLDVAPEAVATDRQLRNWVQHGLTYARSLPPK